MWKDGEWAKKRQKTAERAEGQLGGKAAAGAAAGAAAAIKDQEGDIWDEEALDALFNETIRYSVVNSYVSAITELYAWQSKGKASLPLRGAKLSAVLESVRRDEDRIQRVNFTDRGLFIITGGYDIKGLKKAITWCWETGSKKPGSVESYLRTAAEHLLGLYITTAIYPIWSVQLPFFNLFLRPCYRYPG